MNKAKKTTKKEWLIRIGLGIVITIAVIILYLFAVNFNLFGLFGKSPSMDAIMNPKNSIASQIYSADGVVIGKFYNENRTPVKFGDITPDFWDALISTEDERFYEHHGIDFQGFAAAGKDFIVHGNARGASTITQQLVKNMYRVRTQYSTGLLGYIPGVKILVMKSKEWITALKLEMFYTKNEILNMYANTVDFGSHAYGIKTAARTYFNTTPDSLKTEEVAVLVGLLKATTFYSPIINPDNCKSRRNVVLNNMYEHGCLTKAECDSLSALPLVIHFTQEDHKDQIAPYFREAIVKELNEWCEVSGNDLYADGLQIYTTLDTKMQEYAEQAVLKEMQRIQRDFDAHWSSRKPWEKEQPELVNKIAEKTEYYNQLKSIFPDDPDSVTKYLNKPHKTRVFTYDGTLERDMSVMDSIDYMLHYMHCGFVAMDPQNGHIKAWVGDIDFDSWKYDKVSATHQAGSTFKLFVYTEAMNQGLTPNDRRTDTPITLQVKDHGKDVEWTPTNASRRYSGHAMTLKSAFAYSTNTIAAKLGQECGISAIAQCAYDMGITTKLHETPSLALGASDVKLIDLTNAYSTVANGGERVTPIFVTKIVDADGKTIYENPDEKEKVLSKTTADLMRYMLRGGVMIPGGTSQALLQYIGDIHDTDFGGKTGTTNNNSDGWFVGVSPHLVCGAWVGGEYRSIHFRDGQGQGSHTALPICGRFMRSVFISSHYKKLHGRFDSTEEDDLFRRDEAPKDSVEYIDTLIVADDMSTPVPADNQTNTSSNKEALPAENTNEQNK